MNNNCKQTMGLKFRIIHNKIDKYFDRRKNGTDYCVPKGQGMTLHYLIEHSDEEVFQKDIEKHFGITGATATNILKGLEKNGLIVRIPLEKDARLKKIVLTDKAYKREEHILESINMFEEAIKENFTEEEHEKFLEMMDRVILNIDKLIQDNE